MPRLVRWPSSWACKSIFDNVSSVISVIALVALASWGRAASSCFRRLGSIGLILCDQQAWEGFVSPIWPIFALPALIFCFRFQSCSQASDKVVELAGLTWSWFMTPTEHSFYSVAAGAALASSSLVSKSWAPFPSLSPPFASPNILLTLAPPVHASSPPFRAISTPSSSCQRSVSAPASSLTSIST